MSGICTRAILIVARFVALLWYNRSRRDRADPLKLHRQFARYGTSIDGMPPPEVKRGSDGELVIYNGVTRATRAAKYLPGTPITVELTGRLNAPVGQLPRVGDRI